MNMLEMLPEVVTAHQSRFEILGRRPANTRSFQSDMLVKDTQRACWLEPVAMMFERFEKTQVDAPVRRMMNFADRPRSTASSASPTMQRR